MKGLVQYINERGPAPRPPYYGNDTMLRDITDIIRDNCGEDAWDNCDIIGVDNMLQDISDILENYDEKISPQMRELAPLNKMSDLSGDILVASHNNKACDIADELSDLVDDDLLFAEDDKCIYNGQNVDVYFDVFKDLMICGVSEWQNSREFLWTFYIASNKI